jgi:hypothetical protein
MHLYLATDLTIADGERLGPDEDEHLLLERMPVADAVTAAERGEFADAKSLVALLWLGRERVSPGAASVPAPEAPALDELTNSLEPSASPEPSAGDSVTVG